MSSSQREWSYAAYWYTNKDKTGGKTIASNQGQSTTPAKQAAGTTAGSASQGGADGAATQKLDVAARLPVAKLDVGGPIAEQGETGEGESTGSNEEGDDGAEDSSTGEPQPAYGQAAY